MYTIYSLSNQVNKNILSVFIRPIITETDVAVKKTRPIDSQRLYSSGEIEDDWIKK